MSATTARLICELASVWMVGIAGIMAFLVFTIDRLNRQVAELEARVRALGGEEAATTSGPGAAEADAAFPPARAA